VFVPPLVLAVSSVLIAVFLKALGASNALCISALIGGVVVLLITRSKPKYLVKDGTRLLDNVGTVAIVSKSKYKSDID